MKIRTNILSISAVLLLSAFTTQGAFAMGTPTHTTDAKNLGATTAEVERSGSYRHIGGRVGWVTVPGANADRTVAQDDAAISIAALRVRGGM